MKDSSDQEVYNQVVEEMEDHILSMENHLQDNPKTVDLNLMFRLMHSFKGACHIIGWHDLQVMAHEVEDWLVQFRDGKQKWESSHVDELKYLVSVLRRGKLTFNGSNVDRFDDDKFWIFVQSKQKSQEFQNEIKILVIDDEIEVTELFKELLESRFQCEVVSFNHAHNALEFMRKNKFDIILTDFMMPEMNGLELVEHVRSFSKVPVIMLTAFKPQIPARSEFRENLFFLQKPFDLRRIEYYIKCGLASRKS